jgi:serine/threonine protein kinase/Tfp pilus assembly protein PilF
MDPTPDRSSTPGLTLGHYRLIERIGAGGMGEVWRARDERLERDVALKLLLPGLLADETARKRFRREALALSKLAHPNIAMVFDFDTENGLDFLVMEYVAGPVVTEHLAQGPLLEAEVARLGLQLAEGLAAAHAQGIVHRDLKPGNVRLTPDGRLKILDFGLAKLMRPTEGRSLTASLTEAQALVGTLAYMAPEQVRGEAVDARSDLWSAGLVLYELATGRKAYAKESSAQLLYAILNQTPAPPRSLNGRVSAGLEAIILKCLERAPARRYQAAGELAADLQRLLGGLTVEAERSRVQARRARTLGIAVPVAVVVVLAALTALDVGGLRTRLFAPAPIRSIAVLPLANLSGDPNQEYFADGMTEELITDLAKIASLKVISRTSVMQFKGTKKPLREIAAALGVDGVIEGSVLRIGERVRIAVKLIKATTDTHLWSESYERDQRDILAVQSEVAQAIAREIKVKLTPQEQARLVSARPVNPVAYEYYLKGRFYLNKMTPEGFEKGLAYLKQATEIDPTNPLPFAGLALGYSQVGHEGHPDAFAQARTAARKAEELGGEPPAEMYLAFGTIKLCSDWDFAGAEKDLRRASELNPTIGEAHRWYSWYLLLIRHRDEALAEMKRAQEVEPLTPLFYADRGWQYWWMGQNDKAIEEARKALELDPNFNEAFHVLGLAYAGKGMFAEAITAHQKLAVVDPDWRWSLARTYVLAGRKDEARRLLAKSLTEEPKPTGGWAGWFLAETYAALGEKDEAFRWLEAAYQERHSFLPWLNDNPAYAPLRSDPRFQDLVRRVNAPVGEKK